MTAPRPESLRTIVIDLTPVLPQGENGGAKVFALELVRQMAARRSDVRFVLLTQFASHEELAALDCGNVTRRLVVGPAASQGRAAVHSSGLRLLSRLPAAARQALSRMAFAVYGRLQRRQARRLMRELQADLLFCPFTAASYWDGSIRTVCTVHDVQQRAYPQFFGVEDVVQRDRSFRTACRRATRIAADSEHSRESAIRFGGVDGARVRTIAIRIAEPARAAADGAPVLAALGLEAGRYFLYPANFWKHKNHEMLLTAFAIAAREGLPADVKLVCTGAPGRRRDDLEEAARRMGLGDRASFPGFLPHAQLDAVMRGSLALVFPSLYEGYGLPVVEAMSRGVPVACSDLTSLPEVAGDAARLFDPRKPGAIARALVDLANDAQLRARLSRAGLERSRPLTDVERMEREYWALFEEAAAA